MSVVEIDYRDTLKKADQLEELARELRTIASRDLQDLQSGVSRAWKGSSAERYKKHAQTLSRQVEAQAKNLQNAAKGLRRTAERYRFLESGANRFFGA